MYNIFFNNKLKNKPITLKVHINRTINVFIYLFIFISCNEDIKLETENKENSDSNLTVIKNSFAKHFEIEKHNNFTILRVKKPWQKANDISLEYYLFKKGEVIPEYLKEKNIIRTPIKRVVCMSTSHIAMIDTLEKTETIVGVSGKKFINNKKIAQNKNIPDVGFEQGLNYEIIVNLNPDVVILYSVEGEIAGYQKKLNEMGVSTIFNAEYLEDTPLAKTEWIKFIGVLLDKEKLANSIFNNIAEQYLGLKKMTDSITNKPKVMTGLPWKDIWYVSSGSSNLANIINDAGAEFLWKNDTASDVMALDIESVIYKSLNADYWINISYSQNKKDILNLDSRLENIKAFKQGNLFNNNAILNNNGGNDYFESGIMNPHILLKDLISIFHPEIYKEHKLKYYRRLE